MGNPMEQEEFFMDDWKDMLIHEHLPIFPDLGLLRLLSPSE